MNFDDILKQLRVSVKLEPTGALIGARWRHTKMHTQMVKNSVPPIIRNEANRRFVSVTEIMDEELERRWLKVAPLPLTLDGKIRGVELQAALFDWATAD